MSFCFFEDSKFFFAEPSVSKDNKPFIKAVELYLPDNKKAQLEKLQPKKVTDMYLEHLFTRKDGNTGTVLYKLYFVKD